MAIIVYLTIYTGALVRHTKSSLAYGAWPIPFDDIVPHNAHDWVQFSQRYGAHHFYLDYDYIYTRY